MRKGEDKDRRGGTLWSTACRYVSVYLFRLNPYPLLPVPSLLTPACLMSSSAPAENTEVSASSTSTKAKAHKPRSAARPIRLTLAITPKEAELLGRLRIHFDRIDAKVGNGSHCTGIKSSLPDLIRRIIRVYGVDNAGLIWAAVEQASADTPTNVLDALPPLEGDARVLANRALAQMAQSRGVQVSP